MKNRLGAAGPFCCPCADRCSVRARGADKTQTNDVLKFEVHFGGRQQPRLRRSEWRT